MAIAKEVTGRLFAFCHMFFGRWLAMFYVGGLKATSPLKVKKGLLCALGSTCILNSSTGPLLFDMRSVSG